MAWKREGRGRSAPPHSSPFPFLPSSFPSPGSGGGAELGASPRTGGRRVARRGPWGGGRVALGLPPVSLPHSRPGTQTSRAPPSAAAPPGMQISAVARAAQTEGLRGRAGGGGGLLPKTHLASAVAHAGLGADTPPHPPGLPAGHCKGGGRPGRVNKAEINGAGQCGSEMGRGGGPHRQHIRLRPGKEVPTGA